MGGEIAAPTKGARMAAMIWFRWYRGTVEDGKFRIMARTVAKDGHPKATVRDIIAVWAFLLEDATHEAHRGVCTRDEEAIGAILDMDDGMIASILTTMEDHDMILRGTPVGGDGPRPLAVISHDIKILNWDKRQFENDLSDPTATERKRRQRARHRHSQGTVGGRPGHGDVTAMSRSGDVEDTATTRQRHDQRQSTESEAEKRAAQPIPELSTVPSVETQNRGEDCAAETGAAVGVLVKRPKRLPTDWMPSPKHIADAVRWGLAQEHHAACTEDFKAWAGSSRNAIKLDWDLTWGSWVRRVVRDGDYTNPRSKPPGGTVTAFKPRPPVRVAFNVPALSEGEWLKHLQAFNSRNEWDRAVLGPTPLEPGCGADRKLFVAAGLKHLPVVINYGNGVKKPWGEPATRPPSIPLDRLEDTP